MTNEKKYVYRCLIEFFRKINKIFINFCCCFSDHVASEEIVFEVFLSDRYAYDEPVSKTTKGGK